MELLLLAQRGEKLYQARAKVNSEAEAQVKLRRASERVIIVDAWLVTGKHKKKLNIAE